MNKLGPKPTLPKPSLRFTEVSLENWRNFASVRVELQRRVFLIGPNASGKSNFLDLFRFLHDLVSVGGGFQEAVRKRRGISSLRCLAARRYSDIAVRVSIGDDEEPSAWRYELRFNQDNRQRAVIKEERVVRHGEEILRRPDDKDRSDPDRLTETSLEQVHANQPFRAVADFFASTRYLHIIPQLVREPDRSVGKSNDPLEGDFLEQVARTPEKTRNAWLRRISDALRLAVPQLKELELWRDVRGTPHLRGKYEHWRPQGAWQTEERSQTGRSGSWGGGGPLLLEEPELNLHPEVIRYISQMFSRLQRRTGRQIMVSTHSFDLLRDSGIGVDELLLLAPRTEGTSIRAASSFEDIKALLEGGVLLAEAVIPQTAPPNAQQLTLFGD